MRRGRYSSPLRPVIININRLAQLLISSLIAVILPASGAYGLSQKAFPKVGFVKAFHGDVKVTRAFNHEKVNITRRKQPILFQDVSETEFDSHMEIQLKDGSTLLIAEDTVLTIDEMIYDPKTNYRSAILNLKVGMIKLKATKNRHPFSRFEIKTPTAVAGIRGTEFTVWVDRKGRTRVVTLEGAVAVWKRGASKGSRKEVLVLGEMTTEVSPGDAAPAQPGRASREQIRVATEMTQIGGKAFNKGVGGVNTAAKKNHTDKKFGKSHGKKRRKRNHPYNASIITTKGAVKKAQRTAKKDVVRKASDKWQSSVVQASANNFVRGFNLHLGKGLEYGVEVSQYAANEASNMVRAFIYEVPRSRDKKYWGNVFIIILGVLVALLQTVIIRRK